MKNITILLSIITIMSFAISEDLAPSKANSKTKIQPITDKVGLTKGKAIFTKNCLACHGANAEGLIGPNMTDKYWIHGGSLEDIIHIINVGVIAKGMIPWKPLLSKEEIHQVSSYILTLQGTNPENAKAPEGELVKSKSLEEVETKIEE